MLLDWKSQYCENNSTTNCNLQIQCDPYQVTNGIFQRTRTKIFTILILPTQEHGIFLHLFMSCLISFITVL